MNSNVPNLIKLTGFIGGTVLALVYLPDMYGVMVFVCLTLAAGLSLLATRLLVQFIGRAFDFDYRGRILLNVTLMVFAVGVVLILFETVLQIQTRQPAPESAKAASATKRLTMPPEWERRPADVPRVEAHYWHDKLHVHNQHWMRRAIPYPEKDPARFRVMVVGDSLTYGAGVGVDETYSAVLETEFSTDFEVEVFNLGVEGFQSDDILEVVRKFLPKLSPDLVIYGICLNDFLPSGKGQYENNMAYQVPLNPVVKEFLEDHTLTGRLAVRSYNQLLLQAGLRTDFYGDILKDFDGYQARFARDLKKMNEVVQRNGLPPIVSMVLHQSPKLNSKPHQIAQSSEKHQRNAGMVVLPSEPFFKKYDGKRFRVSPWEGHPNVEAHRYWGQDFARWLRASTLLDEYHRSN